MKNEKYVELRGGTKILVQEVPVRRILTVLPFLKGEEGKEDKKGEVEKTFIEHASELLEATVGLNAKDLLDLYPSDLEKIWQAFREVNSFFFGMADKLGLADQVGTILRSVLDGAGKELATSLSADIKVALTTASAGLLTPSDDPSKAVEEK